MQSTIAEEFYFKRQADRRPGEEDRRSFLRKGVVGDRHNHFSQQVRKTFDWYAGSELLLLGYERDRSWVKYRDKIEQRVLTPIALGLCARALGIEGVEGAGAG